MTTPALLPLSRVAPPSIEQLLDAAFGPDRHRRTAYAIRAGTCAIESLSFAAVESDGRLAGSIQCWPVSFLADAGTTVPMIMVGPVAVTPTLQGSGLGRRLMTAALTAADDLRLPGSDALMLIGDPEYYGRFFGFTADSTGEWRLPGPFEPRRLLARGSGVPSGSGSVTARVSGSCPTPQLT